MTDAGFFRGTSTEQDSRFSDKNKKLMKTMNFAESVDKKIDMKKIKLEVMKPFITERLNSYMTVEDDVLVEYVFSQLEADQHPDGKSMQINMTGFLGKTNARNFMQELWDLLLDAQDNPNGIPTKLIELKKAEMKKSAAAATATVSSTAAASGATNSHSSSSSSSRGDRKQSSRFSN